MQILYKSDSILDATEDYIVHGCNARGRMGSGVARVLFERYPNVKENYLKAYARSRQTGLPFLGTIGLCENTPHIVINAITQESFGYDGALYVSYQALEECMVEINRLAASTADTTYPDLPPVEAVAMPLIGAGLAGGSWATISEIIERVSTHFQPVVYLNGDEVPTT